MGETAVLDMAKNPIPDFAVMLPLIPFGIYCFCLSWKSIRLEGLRGGWWVEAYGGMVSLGAAANAANALSVVWMIAGVGAIATVALVAWLLKVFANIELGQDERWGRRD